jgi:hypothetical protein
MPTNKGDTIINVSVTTRDLLKKLAKEEGRTMKGMLQYIVEKYKRVNK